MSRGSIALQGLAPPRDRGAIASQGFRSGTVTPVPITPTHGIGEIDLEFIVAKLELSMAVSTIAIDRTQTEMGVTAAGSAIDLNVMSGAIDLEPRTTEAHLMTALFTLPQGDSSGSSGLGLAPFEATLYRVVGNTRSVQDLTNATSITLRYQIKNGETVTRTAAIVSPATAGKVRYLWTASDTLTPGSYRADVTVDFSDGGQQTFPGAGKIPFEVAEGL